MTQLNQYLDKQLDLESGDFEEAIDYSILIKFSIGNSNFAIKIEDCVEVVENPNLVKLPIKRENVLGVLNLRGNLLPIIDGCAVLTGEKGPRIETSKIIIIESVNTRFGIAASNVKKVMIRNQLLVGYLDSSQEKIFEIEDELIKFVDSQKLLDAFQKVAA